MPPSTCRSLSRAGPVDPAEYEPATPHGTGDGSYDDEGAAALAELEKEDTGALGGGGGDRRPQGQGAARGDGAQDADRDARARAPRARRALRQVHRVRRGARCRRETAHEGRPGDPPPPHREQPTLSPPSLLPPPAAGSAVAARRQHVRRRSFAHHRASSRQLVFEPGALPPAPTHWAAPGARLGGVAECAAARRPVSGSVRVCVPATPRKVGGPCRVSEVQVGVCSNVAARLCARLSVSRESRLVVSSRSRISRCHIPSAHAGRTQGARRAHVGARLNRRIARFTTVCCACAGSAFEIKFPLATRT